MNYLKYEKFSGSLRIIRRALYFWKVLANVAERTRTRSARASFGTMILCGIPARLAGIKRIVMTEHGLETLLARPETRKLATRHCRYASDITVVEPRQLEYFHRELGFPVAKLHCIPNGVRAAFKTPTLAQNKRRELGIGADVFAFFYVGRLNPIKDLGTMLDAFAALPADISLRTRLYLVGDGPDRAMLETRRNALGLGERVTFLGARSDVSEVLMVADAFVMSSTSEGLPMALLEAMAAGVPCIATAVGGIPDLFADDRGLLVPAQDAPALASAMTAVVRSPELRQRLVTNAAANLKHYEFDAIANLYLELLGFPQTA